jgi:hypothetical protein
VPNTTVFEFLDNSEENDAHARSLVDWLNQSEDLYGAADLRIVPPAEDELGPLADAAVVVGSGGPVVIAVLTWLGERARNRVTSFRIIRGDGARIEFEAKDPTHLQAIEEQLIRFLDEEGD